MKVEKDYNFKQVVGARRGLIHSLPDLEELHIDDYKRDSKQHAVVYTLIGEDGYNVYLNAALWSIKTLIERTDAKEQSIPVFLLVEKKFANEIFKKTDLVGIPRSWIIFYEESLFIPDDGRRMLKRLEIYTHPRLVQYQHILLVDADLFFLKSSTENVDLFSRLWTYHKNYNCVGVVTVGRNDLRSKRFWANFDSETEVLDAISKAMQLSKEDAKFVLYMLLWPTVYFFSVKNCCFHGFNAWFSDIYNDFINEELVLAMWIRMKGLSVLPYEHIFSKLRDVESPIFRDSELYHTFALDNPPTKFMEFLLKDLC